MVVCRTTSRSVNIIGGDTIVLASTPTGTPPYTVTFSKGSSVLSTVSLTGSWPYTTGFYYYTCQSTDVGQQQFTISVTDGCGLTCIDNCYVYIYNENASVGPNLVQNSDLEISSGGLPSNWSKNSAGTPPIFTYESPGYNNTGNCVAISYTSAISNSYGRWSQTINNLIPEHIYQFSGYIKTENIISTLTSGSYDSGAYLVVVFYYVDSTGWHILGNNRIGMYGTTGWTFYSLSAKAPQVPPGVPYTNYIMQISLELSQCSGKAYFDKIMLNDIIPCLQIVPNLILT